MGTYGPTSIAIVPRGNQAYVSLSLAPDILSFSLTPSTFSFLKDIPLNATKIGSNRIRLGVDPWADPTGDYPGKFIGDETRNQAYLYVVARDGSLRIIDVFNPGQEQECETNFDPLNPQINPAMPVDVTPGNVCIHYGDVNRRPYSANSTAGLRFPAVPVDVAAANLSGDNGEDTVNGGYAWVLTASGTIYLVNINPQPRKIKAVVHSSQMELFSPSNPDEPFVYKNGVPTAENLVSEATPFPNQPRDRNVISYTVSLESIAGARAPRPTPAAADDRPVHRTAVDAGDRGRRNGAGQPGAADLRVLPRSQLHRRAGMGRHLGRDGRQPALLGHPERLDAEGWRRRILHVWRAAGRHRHIARLQHRCRLSDRTGLRPRTVARSGARRLQGHRSLHEQEPHGGQQGDVRSVRRQPAPLRDREVRRDRADTGTAPRRGRPFRSHAVRDSTTGFGGATGTGGTGGAGGGAGMTGTGGAAGTGGMAGTGGSAATGGSAGAGGAAGSLDADCHDPTDNSTALFQCVRYNGETRCLNPCVQNQDCRHGRVCLTKCTPATQDADCPGSKTCAPNGQCYARPLFVPCTKNDDCASGMCDLTDMKSTNYMKCLTATGELLTPDACNAQRSCLPGETCIDGQCEIQSLCADGPPLAADQCFPQLTSYQINVNAGFLVTGTQAGSLRRR